MHGALSRLRPRCEAFPALAGAVWGPAFGQAPFRDVTAESGIGAAVWGPTAS